MKNRDVRVINQIENFNVKINNCGVDRHSYLLSENPSIHHYGFFAIYDGTGSYILNGKTFPIKKGDVCYIPRGMPYATKSDVDAPFKLYYLAFNSPDGPSLMSRMGFSIDSPVISTESDYVKKKLAAIFKLLSYDSFNRVMKANMVLFEIFYYFFKRNKANDKINTDKNRYVKIAEDIIQQNYTTNISVDTIAKHLHLNRTYLSHLFVSIKGLSIKQYLTAFRIEKAMDLLHEGKLTIAQIAQEVGFNDSVNFYRQFKKLNYVSPKQFQQNLKNDKGRIQRDEDRLKLLKSVYDKED